MNSAGRSPSSSRKSSSVNISTSESSVLMPQGLPRATATERSRQNKVHHIRFHRRLSVLLSPDDSTLRGLVNMIGTGSVSIYLLCIPDPCATINATRVQKKTFLVTSIEIIRTDINHHLGSETHLLAPPNTIPSRSMLGLW